MTPKDIDNYIVSELKKYNLQPLGDVISTYRRWFKTINRSKTKHGTVLVNISENVTLEEINKEITRVVNTHESILK
jgi:hypothetical protein